MRRISIQPRPDLARIAREAGFEFATVDGEIYWDERAYYTFSLKQIEDDLEGPSAELAQMCRALVDKAARDERILTRLDIPRHAWDLVRESWLRRDPSLYGRFDLAYRGEGPAKLLEYNADTPTALYEASVFQWHWLESAIERKLLPKDADQFNSLHEGLIATLKELRGAQKRGTLHLTCMQQSAEDVGLITYLGECAVAAGFTAKALGVEDIGSRGRGAFVDLDNEPIELLFKLYPWEWMFADAFIAAPGMQRTRFIEPAWKAVLSNKGLLALLWAMAPGHPNLLPAYFEDDPARSALGPRVVRKPLLSREGSNVTILDGQRVVEAAPGPYGSGAAVLQEFTPLPEFDGNFPVIGSWMIGGEARGIGLREDQTAITRDTSRFVPHAIIG